jgi:hypothetical protein
VQHIDLQGEWELSPKEGKLNGSNAHRPPAGEQKHREEVIAKLHRPALKVGVIQVKSNLLRSVDSPKIKSADYQGRGKRAALTQLISNPQRTVDSSKIKPLFNHARSEYS